VVWRPAGQSRAVGLHMSLAKFSLAHGAPHHTIKHLFVIPTADSAAKLLLRMGKECPKHVEFLNL
jgi:hypothetical protein